MRTETITLFAFDELPKDIQKKVLDKHRYIDVQDYDWADVFMESEKELGIIFDDWDEDNRKANIRLLAEPEQVARNLVSTYASSTDLHQIAESYLWTDDEDRDDTKFLALLRKEYHYALIRERDYLTSDEYLKEKFLVEGFEFLADGTVWRSENVFKE